MKILNKHYLHSIFWRSWHDKLYHHTWWLKWNQFKYNILFWLYIKLDTRMRARYGLISFNEKYKENKDSFWGGKI